MQPYHEIKSYSEQVVSNIRWKKARAMIATEIENHLCDQRDAYRKLGDDLDTATKKSIEQMGDPIFLGKELDKAHRPNSQLLSILFIGVLLSLGLVIQSALCSISNTTSTISILSYIIAFGLCVCCYYIDIFHLLHHAKFLYLFALVVSVFALFIATPVRGVRMISFSGITTPLSFFPLFFQSFTQLFYTVCVPKDYEGSFCRHSPIFRLHLFCLQFQRYLAGFYIPLVL